MDSRINNDKDRIRIVRPAAPIMRAPVPTVRVSLASTCRGDAGITAPLPTRLRPWTPPRQAQIEKIGTARALRVQITAPPRRVDHVALVATVMAVSPASPVVTEIVNPTARSPLGRLGERGSSIKRTIEGWWELGLLERRRTRGGNEESNPVVVEKWLAGQ